LADYVKYSLTPELREKQKALLSKVMKGGKIRIGTNEATKAAERGSAKLIVIAEDVQPQEIVMHLPLICKEKNVPFSYCETKKELGQQAGIKVSTSALAITEEGEAKKEIEDFVKKIKELGA
jgi:ribosomal protein eL8